MVNRLATIERVAGVYPIEGADKIEKVKIKGWICVAMKDRFKEGDLCVYIATDSILPEIELFKFMEKYHYRVKTIRLRKVISYGLLFKLEEIAQLKLLSGDLTIDVTQFKEGDDVTELLGIKKYEKPIPVKLQGIIKGDFPGMLRKTDEERIQNFPEFITRHRDDTFYLSEKIDGCLSYKSLIMTDHGYIQIGKIVKNKLNVKILSFNEHTNRLEFKKILKYHQYGSKGKKILSIGVGHKGKGNRNKFITCTSNHEFYTNKGYVEANKLKVGDMVYHYSDGLSFEEQQIILGTLLGDGSIRVSGNCIFIAFGHSVKQEQYFYYKLNLLKRIMYEIQSRRGGFPGSGMIKKATSISSLKLANFIQEHCIKNNKKSLTRKWIDSLTPISLAFWYMDDGSMQNRDELRQQPRITISTNSFNLVEMWLLKRMLYNKYGIESIIQKNKKEKGRVLILNKNSTEQFVALIAPYVPSSMKYKLTKRYENVPCFWDAFSIKQESGMTETKVLSIENGFKSKDRTTKNYVYDLTVEDNHNYFANKILTHNSSATFFKYKGEFGVCSRNLELKDSPDNLFWMMVRKYKLDTELPDGFCIQGELCGYGVQGNPYKFTNNDTRLYVFQVFDIAKQKFFDYIDFLYFCDLHSLETVPILDINCNLPDTVEQLLEMSKGTSVLNKQELREGIVFRTMTESIDYELGRCSFKVVSADYQLLKGE